MHTFSFLTAIFIVLACGIDTFVFGFSYGTSRIKMSARIALFIAFISSVTMVSAFVVGGFLGELIPALVTTIIAASVIGGMGLFKLASGLKDVFILKISKNPELSDKNCDKVLSFRESILVAFILCLDGATGALSLTALFPFYAYFVIFAFSLLLKFSFIKGAEMLGATLAKRSNINLSWLSGLMLIGLAVAVVFI